MTVPAAQTRAGTLSTQPCSQLAPSARLHLSSACSANPRPGDQASPARVMGTHQGSVGSQLPTGRGKGRWATAAHAAATPQEDCTDTKLSKTRCVEQQQPLEPAALLTGHKLSGGGHIGTSASVRQSRLPGEGWGILNCPLQGADGVSALGRSVQHHSPTLNTPEEARRPSSLKSPSSRCRFPPSCLL